MIRTVCLFHVFSDEKALIGKPCGKVFRTRLRRKFCRKHMVMQGELNRPNRKQVGKGRTYKAKPAIIETVKKNKRG